MMLPNFNYIFRRLMRQKLHTLSHILGLTLGIGVCLVIGLFIHHELSFDGYHEKADRIYRMNQVWTMPNGELELDYGAPAPLADAIREGLPAIEEVASVMPQWPTVVEINPQKRFKQEKILWAEASILDVFDFEVVEGNAYEALRKPWHALLTESTARKFYGRENPIGKTFLYDNERSVTVAGVIKDLPNNTHLPASMLISYLVNEDYLGFKPNNTWGMTFGASTYVVLAEGADPKTLKAPLQAIYDQNLNTDPEDPEKAGVIVQPLRKIHFEPEYSDGEEWVKAMSPYWLWFFGIIGGIVLILACINFVNLSTAQSLARSKEVGVRKAIGAGRKELITQFIAEALVLILIAAPLAVCLVQFALPAINAMLGKTISLAVFYHPLVLLGFAIGLVLTALMTGIYPAWLTARFQPAVTLKSGSHTTDNRSSLLRKILVTTQFTLSGALVIAVLLISQQMKLFYYKNLGFDKENVLLVDLPDRKKAGLLDERIQQIQGVKGLTFASSVPSELDHNGTDMHLTNLESKDRKSVSLIFGDERYPDFFDFELKAGRYYDITDTSAISRSLARDQRFPKVVVNQKLIEELGLGTAEEALDRRFKIGWNGWQPEIVGVVENFVTHSLREEPVPIMMFQYSRFYHKACIKLEANTEVATTLSAIRAAWEDIFPKEIYDYEFLDEQINTFYESESKLFGFFKVFAALAILISCIGLWGLATHAALQRTKEIGIRKVLGASVAGLVKLLSKDFLKLVMISFVFAAPLAWYFVNRWLHNFAYRIDLEWWVFAVAGLSIIIIAFLTVSLQSVRAALTNPINSLRNE